MSSAVARGAGGAVSNEIAALLALRKSASQVRSKSTETGGVDTPSSSTLSAFRQLKKIQSKPIRESVAANYGGATKPGDDSVDDKVRYISTLQLLLEALTEQGKLRALLDYTKSPLSLLQELEAYSDAHKATIKIRMLTLELEEIAVQLINSRAELNLERERKSKAENALRTTQLQLSVCSMDTSHTRYTY